MERTVGKVVPEALSGLEQMRLGGVIASVVSQHWAAKYQGNPTAITALVWQ